jgi:hypothetical protein
MKFNTIINRMPFWYSAGKCVYLKSAPGRGKTSVLSSAPAILSKHTGKNMGVVIISGPLLTPADSVGYLVPKKGSSVTREGNTVEHLESGYTDPFWFRTAEGKRLSEYDGGIIVVDEADKMDVDVKKVIGEAALSGRLGPHKLPEGWLVWMAGNRQKDRSGSTKELDHLINRRLEINVSDDVESWTDWAVANNVTPLTIAFANQNPQIVWTEDLPKLQGPWCTPRSLVASDDMLRLLPPSADGNFPDDPDTVEEVSGMIGEAAAGQFFAFVQLEREMPKFADIVAKPKDVRVPVKPDALMLVAYNLSYRVDTDTIAPAMEYVDRMPKEFQFIFAKSACKRSPKLAVHPAMGPWIKANATTINIFQQG